eukprot:gb/GECH01008860.1/.p1 GENE.gb/GECH01008860.1/~~gb/GECH01008860.1/.p1  ORF type:complete len:249 (+),score=54.76 gb/GECH01008860.1/:1-747(+)
MVKSGYYDIDSILAEQESVTTKFNVDAYGLAFLSGNQHERDLSHDDEDDNDNDYEHSEDDPQDTKRKQEYRHLKQEKLSSGERVNMPLWLAENLRRTQTVFMELPSFLSIKFREALRADPAIINLLEKSPHYFELGTIFSVITEDAELQDQLLQAWVTRFRNILTNAQNFVSEDYSSFTRKLTHSEQKLFDIGKSSVDAFLEWKSHGVGRSELKGSAAMLSDTRDNLSGQPKRKRTRTRTRTRTRRTQ